MIRKLNNEQLTGIWHLALITIVFSVCYYFTFDFKVAELGDNATYYMLGKALATGQGYTNISILEQTPNNHYPPGYPALISLIIFMGGGIFAVKLFNGLLLILSLFVSYLIGAKLLNNQTGALIATLLLAMNTHLLFYASIMMSEMAFLSFSLLSLYLYIKSIKKRGVSYTSLSFWTALLSLIIAYYIKSLGLALWGAYLLHLVITKRWRPAFIYFIAFIVAGLPWFIRGQQLGGSSYLTQLTLKDPYAPELGNIDATGLLNRIMDNLSQYGLSDIMHGTIPYGLKGELTILPAILGVLTIVVIMWGILQLRYRLLIACYILGTFAILLVWPQIWADVRFILGLIPFFILGLVSSLSHLGNKIWRKNTYKSYFLGLALVPILLISLQSLHKTARAPLTNAWTNYYKLAKWVSDNTPTRSVISCGKPSLFYLYADRYTLRYAFAKPHEIIADFEKRSVDFVVVDQVYRHTFTYMIPVLKQYPERFEQVHNIADPATYLFKFKK